MNNWYRSMSIILISILAYGCVEPIDLSDLPVKERLVVNSTNLVNRPWSFEISKSSGDIFNYPDVNNAVIKLFGSSGLLEIIEYRQDLNGYQSTLSPSSFQNYRITIETPDLETVTASTYVPSQVLSSTTEGLELTLNSDIYQEIDIVIADRNEEKNYYVINGFSTIQSTDGFRSTTQVGRIKVTDSNAENQYISINQFDSFKYLFVNDATASSEINSNLLELKFFLNINTTALLRGTQDYEPENKVYITVYSVSEGIYNYLFSSDRFLTSNGSSANNLEGSSVVIQTNIEDGLGVFGAFTVDTIQIR